MNITLSNLTALAAYYEKRGRQPAFRKMVRDTSDAAAAEYDLGYANQMIESIDAIDDDTAEKIPVDFRNMGRAGILGMAIIYYGRATKLRDKSRGAVNLAPRLDPDLLADHLLIQNLRDDAIAHLGSGRREGNTAWYKGMLVLRFVDQRPINIGYHNAVIGFDTETYDRLKRLLPRAQQIVRQIGEERQTILGEEIVRLSNCNPDFTNRLCNTQVAPHDFKDEDPTAETMYTLPPDTSHFVTYPR